MTTEVRCEKCQAVLVVGSFPFCRGNPSDHQRGVATVVGDEIDVWQVNGTRHPIHFRSRLERARWRKEHGYRVYDTGAGGQSAAITDAQTLENGRYLVTHRQMIDAEEPDVPLRIRWVDEVTGL